MASNDVTIEQARRWRMDLVKRVQDANVRLQRLESQRELLEGRELDQDEERDHGEEKN